MSTLSPIAHRIKEKMSATYGAEGFRVGPIHRSLPPLDFHYGLRMGVREDGWVIRPLTLGVLSLLREK